MHSQILCVPSVICHLEVPMPSPAKLFHRFHAAGTNGHRDLSLSRQGSEDPLNKPCNI